jgi:hypothetical protein
MRGLKDCRIGIAAVGAGEYLSDGGQVQQRLGADRARSSAQQCGAVHG